jgi:excisionase family DNA binding protein
LNNTSTESPAAYSITDVLHILKLGRTRTYELINAGALPARKLGRRTVILREDVDAFLQNLPRVGA